jgi:hypothetical protein
LFQHQLHDKFSRELKKKSVLHDLILLPATSRAREKPSIACKSGIGVCLPPIYAPSVTKLFRASQNRTKFGNFKIWKIQKNLMTTTFSAHQDSTSGGKPEIGLFTSS